MSCKRWRGVVGAFVPAIVLLALALVLAPTPAQAREYSIDEVVGDLTVNTDGSITVAEERTFDFDGSFHGVYWNLSKRAPVATTNSGDVSITNIAVEDLSSPELGSFIESDSGADGTYQLTDSGSALKVKIFSSHEDESATVRITYTVTNVVNAWADTGELYWKLVSNGWDVPSDNVTYRVHLPVPAGETVRPEDNVRAWGHGPLDASLAFDGNEIVYTIPGVGTSEYAEARVTFPVEWLTGMVPSSIEHMSSILRDEQRWADEANERRERARLELAIFGTVGGISIAATGGLTLFLTRRYKRMRRKAFPDEYFRDVPSADHPAVLGALLKGGKVPSECFTATLMKLTDDGIIGLDLVCDNKGRAKDYQITRSARVATDPVDDAAMHLMFDVVAPRGKDRKMSTAPAAGYSTLRFSDFKRAAKKAPATYGEALSDWEHEVKAAAEKRGFFNGEEVTGRVPLAIFSVLFGLVGMVCGVVLLADDAILAGIAVLVLSIVAMTVGIIMCTRLAPMSREGMELAGKLEALKRWLKDFTLLNEAVPRDVALWDRLLVMAVVLGVADRVIEQLKVAAPEVLASPYFYSYCWLHDYGHAGLDRPASCLTTDFGSAHNVSTAALAASSSSSGGGGGGGFSGGGGGGGAF